MDNTKSKEDVVLPINIGLEKAKNELRYCLNSVCMTYNIPNSVVGLLLESLLAEERQQRITMLSEQSELLFKELKELKDNKETETQRVE